MQSGYVGIVKDDVEGNFRPIDMDTDWDVISTTEKLDTVMLKPFTDGDGKKWEKLVPSPHPKAWDGRHRTA